MHACWRKRGESNMVCFSLCAIFATCRSGAAAAAAAAAGSAEEEEALAVSRRAAVKKTRDKTKGFGNE